MGRGLRPAQGILEGRFSLRTVGKTAKEARGMAEPELVVFVCARCGSRLQVMARAEVKCRCGAQMKPAARDPHSLRDSRGISQRSLFAGIDENKP
jgi:DNA-directed RNA polymerase subunit RPC12/RpoP